MRHPTSCQARVFSTSARRAREALHPHLPNINAFVPGTLSSGPSPQRTGPLGAVSIAIKSNICTKGSLTSCSSNMLRDFYPSYDATVVHILKENGAQIMGMTNCDEFGMGSLNTYSIWGPTLNPAPLSKQWKTSTRDDALRSPGGSSGGSAAAVAADLVQVALGTDTGGSTRLPASYCGIVGFKPSYGMISRWGVVSFADSLDCVGLLASSVTPVSQIYGYVAKPDPNDPTSASLTSRNLASSHIEQSTKNVQNQGDLSGLRIGIPQEYFPAELSPIVTRSIRSIIETAMRLGAEIVPVSLPSTSYALSAYYVLASAEASSNLARYDGIRFGLHIEPSTPPTSIADLYSHSRTIGFGPEVKRRLLLGTYALTADAFDNYFLQAQRVRQIVKNDFNKVFSSPDFYIPTNASTTIPDETEKKVDILLHPSAIRTAPSIEGDEPASPSIDGYVQDVLTVPASLAGLPAISLPCPASILQQDENWDGWPIGFSIVGQWGTDDLVLAVGKQLEVKLA